MQKKSNLLDVYVPVFFFGGLIFIAWEAYQTVHAMSEPAWQEPLLIVALLLLGFILISSKRWVILFFPLILHEIGVLLGGFFSGYSFSGFQIGRYKLCKVKGRFIVKKYPMSIGPRCGMKPPETEPDKSPYRLHLLGGIILLFLFIFVGFFLFYRFQRHVFAYLFGFLPAFFLLFTALSLTLPYKIRGAASLTFLAFFAFPRNPSLRSAYYYVNKILSLFSDLESISEIPCHLIDGVIHHDYSLFEYTHVDVLYEIKAMFHAYRNEFDEEKLCLETIYHSPVVNLHSKTSAQTGLLMYEFLGECRSREVEKYYDQSVKDYLKKHSGMPSTKRFMYAYFLLYENNPALAQKELEEFEKIIAAYPDKIDVTNEWDEIRKIQRCKIWKDSGRTYIVS